MKNNNHNITIPNLEIELGTAKLMFDKGEITTKELVDVYLKLEGFIKSIDKSIHI